MAKSDYLKSRYTEDYLIETRNGRTDSFSAWHDRIYYNDQLIRGDFPVIQPDGSTVAAKPIVGNLVDQMPRDLARLASEVMPSFRCPTASDSQDAIDNAALRGVITEGYFQRGRFEVMRPQLVMDLAVTGAAFAVAWTDSRSDYPKMMRIDPRACYPDVFNGSLQDLLVVQKVKVRQAERMFPDAKIMDRWRRAAGGEDAMADYVEIWDYYCADEVLKAVALVDGSREVQSGLTIVSSYEPKLDMPPVGFAMIPAPDSALRGLIDQVGPGLIAKNQMANYLIEASEQWVHAPFFAQGVINADDPPGANTIYQGDPRADKVEFRRVDPAQSNPQLFGLMQQLDDEQRKQLSYPAQRQGDVNQSIASAAFVSSTQGALTSLTREVQRCLADIQEQLGEACQKLDVNFKDIDKPLYRSVGRKKSYKPSSTMKMYGVEVNYGAGSGLDRLNTDVRLFQAYGAGLISMQTVLENLDYVADASGEIERRQREDIVRILLQRWAGDPSTSIDFMIAVKAIMDEGMDIGEALQLVAEQMQPQQPQAGAGGAGGMQEEQMQQSAGEEQTSIEKGGTPTEAPPKTAFAPPPYTQILAGRPVMGG